MDDQGVKGMCFSNLHFRHKLVHQIVHNKHVRAGKKSQYMQQKLLSRRVQLLPVCFVIGPINFFSGPEHRLLFFKNRPKIMMLNWFENIALLCGVGEEIHCWCQQKCSIYIHFFTIQIQTMENLCVKEEWVSGLWMMMAGNIMMVSGLLSGVVFQPLLVHVVERWYI